MVTQNPRAEEIIDRLRNLLVAKDLFASDWFIGTAGNLFEEEERGILRRVSRETQEERHGVNRVLRRWGERLAEGVEEEAEDIARISRIDFLHALIEGKDAAGEILEKAAGLAPPDLSEELLSLAAVDFRHATDLRKILLKEYPEPPPGVQEEPARGR